MIIPDSKKVTEIQDFTRKNFNPKEDICKALQNLDIHENGKEESFFNNSTTKSEIRSSKDDVEQLSKKFVEITINGNKLDQNVCKHTHLNSLEINNLNDTNSSESSDKKDCQCDPIKDSEKKGENEKINESVLLLLEESKGRNEEDTFVEKVPNEKKNEPEDEEGKNSDLCSRGPIQDRLYRSHDKAPLCSRSHDSGGIVVVAEDPVHRNHLTSNIQNLPPNVHPQNIPLQNIYLQNGHPEYLTLQNIPVQNIPVQNISERNIPVQNFSMQNISVQNIPVQLMQQNIQPQNISHNDFPMSLDSILLQSTPPQNISHQNIPPQNSSHQNISPQNTYHPNIPQNIPHHNIHQNISQKISMQTMSPQTMSPETMSPHTLSPQTMSPRTMSHQIISPHTMSHQIMSPHTMSPQTMSPQAMSPQAMSPQTMSPQTMSPQTMSPQTMSPQTISLQTMSPQTMSPQTMSPQTMSPQTMSPPTMSPPTMTTQTRSPQNIPTQCFSNQNVLDQNASSCIVPGQNIAHQNIPSHNISGQNVALQFVLPQDNYNLIAEQPTQNASSIDWVGESISSVIARLAVNPVIDDVIKQLQDSAQWDKAEDSVCGIIQEPSCKPTEDSRTEEQQSYTTSTGYESCSDRGSIGESDIGKLNERFEVDEMSPKSIVSPPSNESTSGVSTNNGSPQYEGNEHGGDSFTKDWVERHKNYPPFKIYGGTQPGPILCPKPPQSKIDPDSARAKLLKKLDDSRRPKAWGMVYSKPNDFFTKGDKDGDTQLMILVSNKCLGQLECIHAMVERMRTIPNSLSQVNKALHSALYIACMEMNDEPLVPAYIAEALAEQNIDVAKMTYENGKALTEILKSKGESHQEVLKELISVKNSSGQFVFDTHQHDINGNI